MNFALPLFWQKDDIREASSDQIKYPSDGDNLGHPRCTELIAKNIQTKWFTTIYLYLFYNSRITSDFFNYPQFVHNTIGLRIDEPSFFFRWTYIVIHCCLSAMPWLINAKARPPFLDQNECFARIFEHFFFFNVHRRDYVHQYGWEEFFCVHIYSW